jgi:uncharacterized membrane protein YukC
MPPWLPALFDVLSALIAALRQIQPNMSPASAQNMTPHLDKISQSMLELHSVIGPELAKHAEARAAAQKAEAEKAAKEEADAEKKRVADLEAEEKKRQADEAARSRR